MVFHGCFGDRIAQTARSLAQAVGAIMCMVALYANTIITSEVSLQYFVEERFPSMQLPPSAYSATIKHSRSARIKRWLLHHEEGGAAPAYILFNGLVATVLVLLPYKILIEFTMTVMGPPTLLFLASFVALRIQEPDLEREFKIPARLIPRLVPSHSRNCD